MTRHLINGSGYGHATVLKFCRLPRCSAGSSATAELLVAYNFVKCWPMFTIHSLTDLAVNL